MVVRVEVGVPPDSLAPGRHVDERGLCAEFERLVPDGGVLPYLWVTGDGSALDALTERLREAAVPAAVEPISRVEAGDTTRQLYRVEWATDPEVVAAVRAADGVLARGTYREDGWTLSLRFPDDGCVTRFYEALTDRGLAGFSIERVHRGVTPEGAGDRLALTPDQQEALTLAARRGYFSTPREATLADLGAELGVSEQAVSQRLRRAVEEVVLAAVDRGDVALSN